MTDRKNQQSRTWTFLRLVRLGRIADVASVMPGTVEANRTGQFVRS